MYLNLFLCVHWSLLPNVLVCRVFNFLFLFFTVCVCLFATLTIRLHIFFFVYLLVSFATHAGVGNIQRLFFVFNVCSCLSTALLIYFHVFLCIYWSLLPHMQASGTFNVSFLFFKSVLVYLRLF